jgi:hypothetical protein
MVLATHPAGVGSEIYNLASCKGKRSFPDWFPY